MGRRKKVAQQPAYRDALFMESVAARPVRILTEYIDPLVRLRREKTTDTIVMLGSARIQPRQRALARIERLKRDRGKSDQTRREALRRARAVLEMSSYYEQARELSFRLTKWSMTLSDQSRRF